MKQGSASEIPGEGLREIRMGHDQDSACTCRKLSKNDYKTFLLRRMHLIDSLGHLSQRTEGKAEIIQHSREITTETQREKQRRTDKRMQMLGGHTGQLITQGEKGREFGRRKS